MNDINKLAEMNRRDFLACLSAAGVAMLAGGAPKLLTEPHIHPKARADTRILS